MIGVELFLLKSQPYVELHARVVLQNSQSFLSHLIGYDNLHCHSFWV